MKTPPPRPHHVQVHFARPTDHPAQLPSLPVVRRRGTKDVARQPRLDVSFRKGIELCTVEPPFDVAHDIIAVLEAASPQQPRVPGRCRHTLFPTDILNNEGVGPLQTSASAQAAAGHGAAPAAPSASSATDAGKTASMAARATSAWPSAWMRSSGARGCCSFCPSEVPEGRRRRSHVVDDVREFVEGFLRDVAGSWL